MRMGSNSVLLPLLLSSAVLLQLPYFTLTLQYLPRSAASHKGQTASSRPPHEQHALMARWLVHALSWGTVSTVSRHLKGRPYGNTASYSDGSHSDSTGRLFFYLTKLDATAYDAEENPFATLTIAEAQLPGACQGIDPEDPTCAKASLTGKLLPVDKSGLPQAKEYLFDRHPVMRSWPADHGFQVYELQIQAIRLLDYYGGAADITPEEYFAVKL